MKVWVVSSFIAEVLSHSAGGVWLEALQIGLSRHGRGSPGRACCPIVAKRPDDVRLHPYRRAHDAREAREAEPPL